MAKSAAFHPLLKKNQPKVTGKISISVAADVRRL